MPASRAILCLLLAYQAWFLNVLLPGHARGAVTVDGKHSPAACCGGGGTAPGHDQVPSQRDRDHCALCQFAAGLTSVPVARVALADLGLLERLPVQPPAAAVPRDPVATYLACGPPPSPARA